MSVSPVGARARIPAKSRSGAGSARLAIPLVRADCNTGGQAQWSDVELGDCRRKVFVLRPKNRGAFREQLREVLGCLESVLLRERLPMAITTQTVFLRDAADRAACEEVFRVHYGELVPVTNYVVEPPCSSAALALEVWTIGGADLRVQQFGPQTLAVTYDSVRWVYCCGIQSREGGAVYAQTTAGLTRMREALERAGSGLEHAVRTWLYLGEITELECNAQRYMELNRARTDFYKGVPFYSSLLQANIPHGVYPASTGIGMRGRELLLSCITLQTSRKDAFLVPLENPQQTPAYAYHPRYSPQSPKFSRAMALVLGNYVTTWISGTASIVNSETQHLGDIGAQTGQTIDNIERLIGAENFTFHGVSGAGASLKDLAKIRVYVKRPQDFERCQSICQARFGDVPAAYVLADVCRPELLVEIEGVAFSRYSPSPQSSRAVL